MPAWVMHPLAQEKPRHCGAMGAASRPEAPKT
jgi:hypothetical protein